MYEPREHKLFIRSRFAQRGIYWLPNMFTIASLFSGFYSIVQAMNGRFEYAAMAILVAMVFDGLDGRIARFTRTQSAFGAELDSLSDMVSFGVAPARHCGSPASTPCSTSRTSAFSRDCRVRPPRA